MRDDLCELHFELIIIIIIGLCYGIYIKIKAIMLMSLLRKKTLIDEKNRFPKKIAPKYQLTLK